MATFQADFEVVNDGIYANQSLFLADKTTLGRLPSDVEIDGPVSLSEIDTNDYVVTEITKEQWKTSDGFFYGGEENFEHVFRDSGTKQVELKVWSEAFITNDGRTFYFTHTVYKDIEVKSRFLKLLKDINPTYELTAEQSTEDFYTAAAEFFERLHQDTSGVFDLWSAERIPPQYFEYLSLTLGHDSFYSQKIGYSKERDVEFADYNIYDRIKNNAATREEITAFRRFLMFSSALFRGKGTPLNVSQFLSLFSIDGRAVELWTQTWGQVPVGETQENFIGFDLENNDLGFVWNNLRAIGNCNDRGSVYKTLNSIILDNFHSTQWVEYDADSVGESDEGWIEFELDNSVPYVRDVFTGEGTYLVDREEYKTEPSVYEIIPNDPVREDSSKPAVLQIDPDYVDYGDRFAIAYHQYQLDDQGEAAIIDSMVASREKMVTDMDISVKFQFLPPSDPNTIEAFRFPENEVFVALRGVPKEDDLYAHFNEYYRVSVNARRSTVSVAKVIKSESTDDVIYQKLNLSGDNENPIYDLVFNLPVEADPCATDEETSDAECTPFTIKENTFYELLVQINGSLLSVSLRENDEDTDIQQNIDSDTGGSDYGVESTNEFVKIIDALDLDVGNEAILALDIRGNEIISTDYVYTGAGGNYGVGGRNSVIEIEEVTLNNLDPDETLYTTTEKEFNLKPKYLEWLGRKLLRFNNTRENKENFTDIISSSFDSSVTDYRLDEEQTDALEFIYFDDALLNEDVATRFNVTFDRDWMESTFTDANDLLSKVIVPFGSEKMWWMPDLRPQDKDVYKNYEGGTDTSTPSPTGSDNLINLPGLYLYNNSTILDNYDIKPDDNFSNLLRFTTEDDTFSPKFYWSEKMCQYQLSNKPIAYKGVFQEVVPHSTDFTNSIELNDGTTYRNPVFLPIIYRGSTGRRLVGVRFKNCDDIERLITNLSTDVNKDVQLWGQYEFELPEEAVKFRPDRDTLPAAATPGHVIARAFLPMGVLSEDRRTYGLSTEYLHDLQNAGSGIIDLKGVFVRVPRGLTYFREGSHEVELFPQAVNPYEDFVLGLECRHYMSAAVYLGSALQPFDYGDTFPTSYILDKDWRSMLDVVGQRSSGREDYACELCQDTYNYEDDVGWWLPSEVWYKRDFVKQPFSTSSDILSGINYDQSNDFNKYFYNFKIDAGSPKPKALSFLITDGDVNPETMYYAKVNVRIDYTGFNWSQIDEPEQQDNAINEGELQNVAVEGGKRSYYRDYRQSPSGACITFYVPISWYKDGQIPAGNTIEWFNYIVGSAGTTASSPTITMTPIGLMTYLLNESGEANRVQITSDNVSAQLLLDVTKGWDITDWNRLFESHVDVEFIAERVPQDKYKLYDKLTVIPDYDTNVGAFIDVDFNVADPDSVDWEVVDSFRIYVKSQDQTVFNVPNEVKDIRDWILGVKKATLNNLVVNPDRYELVSKSLLRLNQDPFFNAFEGADLRGNWFFDLFFDNTIVKTVEDDFNTNKSREIDWLPYESDDDDVFSVTARRAATDLVFESNDLTYELVDVLGNSSFKSINTNTALGVDYKKTGKGNKSDNEIQFSKSEEPNIRKLYMVDDNNIIFDLSTTVYFDPALNEIKNYQGKRFDLILKANNVYDPVRKKNVLGGYYFVGIGGYDFDIGVGVARYNTTTGEMEKSFLSAFGDYNVRGVKTGVWYDLRAIVTSDFIRVIFNERDNPDRLVLNYNISALTQDDPNRYLSGDFEELVYLVTGLQNLDITYPDKVSERTSQRYLQNNFDEDLVKEYRPSGNRAGMVFYNEYTYVDKVTYTSQIPGDKTFGDSHDKTDKTTLINELRQSFGVTDEVEFISRTAKGNEVLKAGDKLFYKLVGKPLNLYDEDVQFVTIEDNNVIVQYGESRRYDVIIVDEDFQSYRSVFVKDDTFHLDHLYKYLGYTNRRVENIWTGEGLVHIEFEDLD
jgi:hypothetical protein